MSLWGRFFRAFRSRTRSSRRETDWVKKESGAKTQRDDDETSRAKHWCVHIRVREIDLGEERTREGREREKYRVEVKG